MVRIGVGVERDRTRRGRWHLDTKGWMSIARRSATLRGPGADPIGVGETIRFVRTGRATRRRKSIPIAIPIAIWSRPSRSKALHQPPLARRRVSLDGGRYE